MSDLLKMLMAERDILAAKVAAINEAVRALAPAPAGKQPAPDAPRKKYVKVDAELVRKLHAQGHSDTHIAFLIGCSQPGVAHCRSRLGLPANFRRGRPPKQNRAAP